LAICPYVSAAAKGCWLGLPSTRSKEVSQLLWTTPTTPNCELVWQGLHKGMLHVALVATKTVYPGEELIMLVHPSFSRESLPIGVSQCGIHTMYKRPCSLRDEIGFANSVQCECAVCLWRLEASSVVSECCWLDALSTTTTDTSSEQNQWTLSCEVIQSHMRHESVSRGIQKTLETTSLTSLQILHSLLAYVHQILPDAQQSIASGLLRNLRVHAAVADQTQHGSTWQWLRQSYSATTRLVARVEAPLGALILQELPNLSDDELWAVCAVFLRPGHALLQGASVSRGYFATWISALLVHAIRRRPRLMELWMLNTLNPIAPILCFNDFKEVFGRTMQDWSEYIVVVGTEALVNEQHQCHTDVWNMTCHLVGIATSSPTIETCRARWFDRLFQSESHRLQSMQVGTHVHDVRPTNEIVKNTEQTSTVQLHSRLDEDEVHGRHEICQSLRNVLRLQGASLKSMHQRRQPDGPSKTHVPRPLKTRYLTTSSILDHSQADVLWIGIDVLPNIIDGTGRHISIMMVLQTTPSQHDTHNVILACGTVLIGDHCHSVIPIPSGFAEPMDHAFPTCRWTVESTLQAVLHVAVQKLRSDLGLERTQEILQSHVKTLIMREPAVALQKWVLTNPNVKLKHANNFVDELNVMIHKNDVIRDTSLYMASLCIVPLLRSMYLQCDVDDTNPKQALMYEPDTLVSYPDCLEWGCIITHLDVKKLQTVAPLIESDKIKMINIFNKTQGQPAAILSDTQLEIDALYHLTTQVLQLQHLTQLVMDDDKP
jgi:hypothetical protein